jgi:hypothetical protein
VGGIREYIRDEVLRRRLKQASVMVVYDPAHRYLDVCQELMDETIAVVNASERGIESRETAMQTFVNLARQASDCPKELLLYVPTKAPQSDEDRMKDPFAIYTVCGGIFPDGDGDEYLSLCLKAKPDHATEIRSLFEKDISPSFEMVDNIGDGTGYPTLRTLLKVDSARNILLALLAPSEQQKNQLKENKAWLAEAKGLLRASLGLKLVTKGKSWSAVADELWRFILYSEFVFDLPGDLPVSLGTVPCAIEDADQLVEDLCETLRHDIRTRQTYIDRAEQVEAALNLPEVCTGIEDLGRRDTFPFEERTFLASAVRALKEDRLDDIRDIVVHHRNSVWLGKGESQAQWGLVDAALSLVAGCEDAERGLADHARSLESLIDHYADRLREIDRLQREFEQAVGEYLSVDTIVDAVTDHARGRYAKITEKIQIVFTKHLETVGWPPQGRLANADVFDSFVAPLLGERGHRVAYFMVDALRYELGHELHRQLANDDAAEIMAAHAQFPTVTPIGMASLLPSAGAKLRVERDGNGVAACLDGQSIGTVAQRMGVFQAIYGDRFTEMTLSKFISGKKTSISDTVDLLVLRSTEIDSHLENNPESTLGLVHQTLRAIRVAVHRLKESGFSDIVIATDHGFFLNGHADAGDLCAKPPGDWINVHDRSLLGEGSGDTHNFAVAADKVGIRSDLSTYSAPRSMAPYRRGLRFFHGGPSLQEAVVPVITVKLQGARPAEQAQTSVTLSYRDGAKRITTRLPVVNVMVESTDMFAQETDIEILIEAHDNKDAVIGEAKRGDLVDPASGTLTMKPGQQNQVTVRMDLEFEGKFTLKALNPVTMAAYSVVELETDYAV